MDMEMALRARLRDDAALTGLIAGRVYWMERPQGSALPSITLQLIADDRMTNMVAFDQFQPGYVQVDAWATSYGQGKAIKEAVIAALAPPEVKSGIRFTRAFVTGRDLVEQGSNGAIYRQSLDFTFHYASI